MHNGGGGRVHRRMVRKGHLSFHSFEIRILCAKQKVLLRSQNSGSTDGGRSDKTAGKSKGVKTPAKGGRDRTATIKGRETKGREIQLDSFTILFYM